MFHSMRYLGSSWLAKIMVVFIAVAFAMWGVGDVLRSSGTSYAAKVGGHVVSLADFQHQKNLLNRQMQALGMAQLDTTKLDAAVVQQLVQQQLLVEGTRDLGLFVNEPLLARKLREYGQFNGKDGKFNAEAFRAMLANARISEATFSEQLRRETAGQFLIASLDMSQVPPAPAALALAGTVAAQTRDAVIISLAARPPSEAPAENELREYYETNKLRYLTPPSRTLEYVTFAPGEIEKWVDRHVTDEMRQFATQNNPTASPAKLAEILRPQAREQAGTELKNSVEDALAGGSTLAGALEKLGLKVESHLLENITPENAKNRADGPEKSAVDQGMALGDGEISGLITTPRGIALMVAVKSTNPASPKPYETVASEVRTGLTQQRAREASRQKAQEIKIVLAQEKDWRAALSKFGVEGRVLSNLARPQEGKPSPYGMPESLHRAVFERNVGEVAGPLTLPNGDQIIALVTATHFPKSTPGAKETEAQSKALMEQVNRDINAAAFEALIKKHPVKINPQLLQSAPGTAP